MLGTGTLVRVVEAHALTRVAASPAAPPVNSCSTESRETRWVNTSVDMRGNSFHHLVLHRAAADYEPPHKPVSTVRLQKQK